MSETPRKRFLLDENVPDAVGRFLARQGCEVLYARDLFARGTPDEILAFAVELDGLVLVTHDKDFKSLRRVLPQGHRTRIAEGSGQLILQVRESRAALRLEREWDAIEFHFASARRKRIRFIVRVTETSVIVTTNAPA